VSGFGGVLEEMLRKVEGPRELLIDIGGLAAHCQAEAPDMQQVLIILRLLRLRLRHSQLVASRPVDVRREEALARHWRPLTALASFASRSKSG
jgi:hypothetical protein